MSDCDERLALVKKLAAYHRQSLLDRNRRVNDPTFASGAAWSVYALDRILLACDGETDPGKLGMGERRPGIVAVQEALFGVADSKGVERHCEGCGANILPKAPGRSRNLTHAGRGLCQTCYDAFRREGKLDDHGKKTYTREELLEEWVIMCRAGWTREQAAQRLNMKPESFKCALRRARKDGDRRALLDRNECIQRHFAS